MNPPAIIFVVIFCAVALVLVGASLHRIYKRTHTDDYGREMRLERWNPNYYPQDQVERLGEVRRITNMQVWYGARGWRREASPESGMMRTPPDRSMHAIAFDHTEQNTPMSFSHLNIPNMVGSFVQEDESDSDAYGMPASHHIEPARPAAVVKKRWTQHGAPRRSQMMNNPVLTLNDDTDNLIEQGPNSYELQAIRHPHRSSSVYSEFIGQVPAPEPAHLPTGEGSGNHVKNMVQQWENVL